jgi:hypothetical protein
MEENLEKIGDQRVINFEFTHKELIYIDDNLSMNYHTNGFKDSITLRIPKRTDCILAGKELIDIIGRGLEVAFRFPNAKINLSLSEADLYIIRELALSSIEMSGEKVGLNLKKKVIEKLYFDNEKNHKKEENKLKEMIDEIDFQNTDEINDQIEEN